MPRSIRESLESQPLSGLVLVMMHRLREALPRRPPPQISGSGRIVEADETYFGRLEGVPMQRGFTDKDVVSHS
jgi:hypothetical protein